MEPATFTASALITSEGTDPPFSLMSAVVLRHTVSFRTASRNS